MKNDVAERRIAVVAVTAPGARMQVHLDVAGARDFVAQLDDRAAEIRPSLAIPESRMKNAHGLSVQGGQRLGSDTLVPPDLLEEPFAGHSVLRFVKQTSAEGFRAPGGVGLERTD
jgi:hypothetical protein